MKEIKGKWAKKCSECGKVLRSHNKSLLCEFHYREANKERHKQVTKRYYERNREKIIKKQTEYNQRPDIKLKRKEYSKKYREKNKEKIKKYNREYSQREKLQSQQNKQSTQVVTTL